MNGKRLRCGSVPHNLAPCDRPGRLNEEHEAGKGKSTPARAASKPPAGGRTAELHHAQPERRSDKSKDKKKGKGKGKTDKNQQKAKAKTEEIDFADEDQHDVEQDANVMLKPVRL